MKKMIRLALATVAAICTGVISAAYVTSAEEKDSTFSLDNTGTRVITTYDPCDVNHDGDVDIFDVILINSFLSGGTHVSNYNVLDADRNMIVDGADAEYVAQRMVGNNNYFGKFIARTYNGSSVGETQVSYQLSGGTYLDGDTSMTTSRAYSMRNYNTGSSGVYYLSPLSPITINAFSGFENDLRGVVDGSDNRYKTTLPENSGIVLLKIWDDNQTPFYATGFIVGNHQIATAASNLWGTRYNLAGAFYKHVEITTYNSNGYLTGTTLNEIAAHVPQDYMSASEAQKPKYDYGMITVEDNLSTYPKFAIGNYYNLSTTAYSHIPLYVTGNLETSAIHRLASGMGNFSDYNASNTSIIHHNVDTSVGQNGAPTYTIIKDSNNNYYYTAVSIYHDVNGASYYNCGTRFTKYHKQFYLNNFMAEEDWE